MTEERLEERGVYCSTSGDGVVPLLVGVCVFGDLLGVWVGRSC